MSTCPWRKRSWACGRVIVLAAIFLGIVSQHASGDHKQSSWPATEELADSREASLEGRIYEVLREDRCLNQPGLNWVLFVRNVQDRQLVDLVLKHRGGNGRYDFIARARQASIRIDLQKKAVIVRMRQVQVLWGPYLEAKVFSGSLPSFSRPPFTED